jgi:hypothetical protein
MLSCRGFSLPFVAPKVCCTLASFALISRVLPCRIYQVVRNIHVYCDTRKVSTLTRWRERRNNPRQIFRRHNRGSKMSAHRAHSDTLVDTPQIIDPGTGGKIVPDRDPSFLDLQTAAAETRVLGTPTRVGQELTIAMSVDVGACTITQAGSATLNEAGNTTLTFDDPGERATLVSILVGTTLVWRIKSTDGASLS